LCTTWRLVSAQTAFSLWFIEFNRSRQVNEEMLSMGLTLFLAQAETTFHEPSYFKPVILGMLALGAVTWLVAAVLGFARARAFGSSIRWFSFAAVCMLFYHLQFIGLGFGLLTTDNNLIFTILTFFNLFVVLAAICAIIGFIRLTSPR
jgi:hypothetical protein